MTAKKYVADSLKTILDCEMVQCIVNRSCGLGDAIDASKSDWVLGFNDRSLTNPDKKGWAVKRDGGIFDQFTGATVSPRAVVNAVHRSLLYFDAHKDELFAKPSMPIEGQTT